MVAPVISLKMENRAAVKCLMTKAPVLVPIVYSRRGLCLTTGVGLATSWMLHTMTSRTLIPKKIFLKSLEGQHIPMIQLPISGGPPTESQKAKLSTFRSQATSVAGTPVETPAQPPIQPASVARTGGRGILSEASLVTRHCQPLLRPKGARRRHCLPKRLLPPRARAALLQPQRCHITQFRTKEHTM